MPNSDSQLSKLLQQREPSYEESRDRADRAFCCGIEIANAYTAGFYRALEELRKLEAERG